ncbi:hypothetical protein ACQ33O_03610 [Ferruginibacter sp. SUN002]|uniref:hypothetical protein n=1 Tax=Ferruginibacter sp. SUN002 TaxID=2937789 RepID=UPI003D3646F7
MTKRKTTYTIFQKATAIFLMLNLLWLTVSTPFVAAAQQELAKQQKVLATEASSSDDGNSEDCTNNNVEEKVPSSTNLAEEFLHDHHITHHFFSVVSHYHKLENADNYIAYHGELHVPPPNAA